MLKPSSPPNLCGSGSRTVLPDYMTPAAILTLEAFPLTSNGKLDRRQPARARFQRDHGRLRRAAHRDRTRTRRDLARSSQLDRIDIHANFFKLGGHSLTAVRAITRVRAYFSVDLPIRLLFERASIAAFAREIDKAVRAGAGIDETPIPPADRNGPLPLSFAQERLWFLDKMDGASATYNIPLASSFKCLLDVSALARALRELVGRHEILRTVYRERDDNQPGARARAAPLPGPDRSRRTFA